MSDTEPKRGESLWLPGFEDELHSKEVKSSYDPIIQGWVNVSKDMRRMNISAENIKKIRRELGANCLISWNPNQQGLNFNSERVQDDDPWEDIGKHGDIREFEAIPPNYIFLTNQNQNGPCLIFTNKKPNRGIAIFYCDKIELDEKKGLTGICNGTEVMDHGNPEKFITFFNDELKKLSTGNKGK